MSEEEEGPSEEDRAGTKQLLAEADAMRRIGEVLDPLPGEKRIRVLRAAAILLGLPDPAPDVDRARGPDRVRQW